MFRLVIILECVFFATYALAKEDLCPVDMASPKVQFFRGDAPIGDFFSGLEIEKWMKGLTELLVSSLKKDESNFTWPEFNFNFNFTDDFNISQMFDSDPAAKETTTPASVVNTEMPKKAANPLAALGKVLPKEFKKGAKNLASKGFKKADSAIPSKKESIHSQSSADNNNSTATTSSSINDPLQAMGLSEEGDNTTDTAAESWGISLPYNTLKAELAIIEGGAVREITVLDADDFATNKTKNDTSKFRRYVNLAEFNLTEKNMIIVCLSLAMVKSDKQSTCQRCTLLPLCDEFDSECAQKFLALRAPESKVHPRSVGFQFLVNEPPLVGMKFVTRLSAKPADQRCESSFNESQSSVQQVGTLHPYTVTYLDVQNLSPKYSYTVQVDLRIDWNDDYKAPFKWPNPLLIQDYLASSSNEEILINACSSEKQ